MGSVRLLMQHKEFNSFCMFFFFFPQFLVLFKLLLLEKKVTVFCQFMIKLISGLKK